MSPAAKNFPFLPPSSRANFLAPRPPTSFFAAKSFAIATVSFTAPPIRVLVRLKINLPSPVPNTRYNDNHLGKCLPRNCIIFFNLF